MKKFMLRIMAWLMAVAMMMPFAGTNLSAQAATYVGDYGSAWQFTSADFEGISGKATITLDIATTGDKEYYQFCIYKNVDGWPKLEQSNLADDKYQINSWGFIDIKPDDTKVTFTLTEQTVKELQTEYEIGIQVFGVIINDAKVSGAAAKATPTPAPTATPAPTKAPAAATPTKAPAAPTKTPEPTKAPATTVGKELVVTKDMVKNGTVTIENAKYDTIEIPRDIDAKSVTLKNVTAGALEVQSGADYVVTLSGSDVDALAVTNPEVPGISQKTLLQMIKDKKAITEEVLLAYRAYTEQAAKVANLQPVINATGTNVDKVTVSGSAKLSVTGCDVLVDAKGANAALNVELAGFAGSVDVAVESVDNGYSIANLTLTNSNVAKVNVSGKDGSCKITGNSDVDNVVVSGKNTVTVDVDAKEVSVDKNTTDAKVRIYGAVDTVNVAGKENDIVLASAAAVKTANVTGSDIRVYGYGKLENAEITGTGANVAVAGTAVNGENDFTTPEVMKEMNPLKEIIRHKQDISSTPDEEEDNNEDNNDDNNGDEGTTTNPPAESSNLVFKPTDASLTVGGYGYEKEANGDALDVTISGQYQEIQFTLPSEIDLTEYSNLIIDLVSNKQLDIKLVIDGTSVDNYTAMEITAPVEIDLTALEGEKLTKINFMACSTDGAEVTINSITFVKAAGDGSSSQTPEEPSDLVFKPTDASLTVGGYGYEKEANGDALDVTISGQYQEIQFTLPSEIDLTEYSNLVIDLVSNKQLDIKLVIDGTNVDNYTAMEITAPVEIDLTALEGEKLTKINFMACSTDGAEVTINSITFVK